MRLKDVPLKKLLSHVETKDELTKMLSKSILELVRSSNRNLTVAFRNEAYSTVLNADDLRSNHEEADTKLLLHAIHATKRGIKHIRIYSPDTDVLVLSVRRVPIAIRLHRIHCNGTKHARN